MAAGAFAALCTAFFNIVTAYADINEIITPIKTGLGDVYNVMLAIVLPIGAVAVGVCGIKIIWGNQKSAEEGKSAIIRILVALAVVFLAPLLISSVSGMFKNYSNTSGVFN